MNATPEEPEYVDDKPTPPPKDRPKKGKNILDPPTEWSVAVTMNRKHVKRLGKPEYKKMVKLLFKDEGVHHVDVALNDGAIVRFVR